VLVRTGGRWGSSSSSGDSQRSWLLIKHRDNWAGDVDITEFAPRSVKSEGDFEDILAADKPEVWESHRPAKGGEAGAMLATIIERAARMKREKEQGTRDKGQPTTTTTAAKKTKPARAAKAGSKPSSATRARRSSKT
jgi:hypothetical protein